MPIVSISKIQHRYGLSDNGPSNSDNLQLSAAELGWELDTRRLFIGNGPIAEGAPVIGNTEILTEHTNIIAIDDLYKYTAELTGYTHSTQSRTLQSKLDEYVSVRDYGAVGDGTTDDTDAIKKALEELFAITTQNNYVRRTLFFPAGVYNVRDTIGIPPFAKLVGEGKNSSVIMFDGEDTSVPVVTTVDGRYQQGVNISEDNRSPQNIEVNDMSFERNSAGPVLDVASSTQCVFRNINFSSTRFNFDISNATTANPVEITTNSAHNFTDGTRIKITNVIGMTQLNNNNYYVKVQDNTTFELYLDAELTSSVDGTVYTAYSSSGYVTPPDAACLTVSTPAAAIGTNNIVFENCSFQQNAFGVEINDDVFNIVFNGCYFDSLKEGVKIGETLTGDGPRSISITNSYFNNINQSAIHVYNGPNTWIPGVNSAYNYFGSNVANSDGASPTVEVIKFENNGNTSIGDVFERNDTDAAMYARVSYNTETYSVNASDGVYFGYHKTEAGRSETLTGNATNASTGLMFDSNNEKSTLIYYTATNETYQRQGMLRITGPNITDEYNETANIGLEFLEPVSIGDNITLNYTLTTSTDVTFKYSVQRML